MTSGVRSVALYVEYANYSNIWHIFGPVSLVLVRVILHNTTEYVAIIIGSDQWIIKIGDFNAIFNRI